MNSGSGCVGSGSGGTRNSRRKESRSPEICLVDGTSHLLFHIMKGVKEQFHSRMPTLLPILIQTCSPQDDHLSDSDSATTKSSDSTKRGGRKRKRPTSSHNVSQVAAARRSNNFLVLQGTLFLMAEHTRAAQRCVTSHCRRRKTLNLLCLALAHTLPSCLPEIVMSCGGYCIRLWTAPWCAGRARPCRTMTNTSMHSCAG
jgi:hypothetical protein